MARKTARRSSGGRRASNRGARRAGVRSSQRRAPARTRRSAQPREVVIRIEQGPANPVAAGRPMAAEAPPPKKRQF